MQAIAADATIQQTEASSEQLQSMLAQHESEMAVRPNSIGLRINLVLILRRAPLCGRRP